MAEVKTVWVDLETTGLTLDHVILEIGIRLGDRFGNKLQEFTSLVWEGDYPQKLKDMDPLAREIHTSNDLLRDLAAAEPKFTFETAAVERRALDFLDNYNVPHGKLEMAGNNVCFDRQRVAKYMPTLHDHFHYRNLDISSFKVSCSRLNPEVFDQMKKPESIHRPLSCIAQSVAEYNFYIDNFLFVSDEHRD